MLSAKLSKPPQTIPTYIEDVFSTYLYNGVSNTALQIQNGIDLSTKGGMVWMKCRSNAVNHALIDTARGVASSLQSNSTNAAASTPQIGSFNTDGFTHSATPTNQNLDINETSRTFASWTFRKQPKFFDVVTFTTDSSSNATFSHSLGSSPGCVIFKKTGGVENWFVWHRSLPSTNYYLNLNLTNAQSTTASSWISVSSTSISVMGAHLSASSAYVAYVFAHDAGGFGLTGVDNVISCGSVTSTGSTTNVTLGYEPQWVLVKRTDSAGSWVLVDSMRGNAVLGTNSERYLFANATDAEGNTNGYANPTATGFQISGWASGATFIYIAIRRGPMKVPTDGTTVFSPIARTVSTGTAVTTNFPVDLQITCSRPGGLATDRCFFDRLRGLNSTTTASNLPEIESLSTDAEASAVTPAYSYNNTGYTEGSYYNTLSSIFYNFKRAPSFFDVVCYTGDGINNRIVPHNLGAEFELAFIKKRSAVENWAAWATPNYSAFGLNSTSAASTGYPLSSKATGIDVTNIVGPSSSPNGCNTSGATYVAYLFATCAGVSKVGSYTGTAATLQVNCGFAAGARFVLIKRTDSTGNWYVWDSARGIVSGNDPYLLLNSSLAETTTTDFVDTYSAGFEISSTASTSVNVSGGTYIFLAIA